MNPAAGEVFDDAAFLLLDYENSRCVVVPFSPQGAAPLARTQHTATMAGERDVIIHGGSSLARPIRRPAYTSLSFGRHQRIRRCGIWRDVDVAISALLGRLPAALARNALRSAVCAARYHPCGVCAACPLRQQMEDALIQILRLMRLARRRTVWREMNFLLRETTAARSQNTLLRCRCATARYLCRSLPSCAQIDRRAI